MARYSLFVPKSAVKHQPIDTLNPQSLFYSHPISRYSIPSPQKLPIHKIFNIQCLTIPGVLKVFESRSIFSLPPTLRGPQDYYTE